MSEPEMEATPDDTTEDPVSLETVTDDEQEDEDLHAAERADDEPAGEPEPEPADDQGEGSAEAVARMDKLLSRASQNYTKAITKIDGLFESGWAPCPLCADHAPGLLSPMPPSDETVAAVRPLIGLPDLTTYVEDRFARKCERCQGRGKTLTGSTVPSYATMQCADCGGTGFQSAEQGFARPANGTSDIPVIPPTHVDDPPTPALPPAAVAALESMLESARNAGIG